MTKLLWPLVLGIGLNRHGGHAMLSVVGSNKTYTAWWQWWTPRAGALIVPDEIVRL